MNNLPKFKKNIAFLFFLTLGSIFILWKCKFGFSNVDESFFISSAYRLYKGDSLFFDEWHLSQMSYFLTLPLVSFYIWLKGSTQGIALFLRYACAFFQIATAIFLYVRLKKFNYVGAIIASISYLIYIPFGIMALSYNSMGIMMMIIFSVIIFTAEKKVCLQYLISGVFFAAAVLCCPYLLFVFLIYWGIVILGGVVKKRGKALHLFEERFFSFKSAILFTLGATILAVVFAVFVFSRASLSEIVGAFGDIFNDPEHQGASFFKNFLGFFYMIVRLRLFTWVLYPLVVLLFLAWCIDKNRKNHKEIYIISASISVILLMLGYFFVKPYINYLMWPINILAFFIFLAERNDSTKKIFTLNWCVGMIYAFCLNATSNQRFYAISSASSVATVGSIIIVCIYVSNHFPKKLHLPAKTDILKKASLCLIVSVFVLQMTMQVYLRYNSVYWEPDMASQTKKIDFGFNSGIYVSEEKYDMYLSDHENLKCLEAYKNRKVLFLSEKTWYYLMGDYEFATYSAWLSGVTETTFERLESYFKMNPNKTPDAIYSDLEYENIALMFSEKYGYKIEERSEKYILLTK